MASVQEEKNEISERKGRMAPLEDYMMKLYGNGKLVTLERISHTKEMNKKKLMLKAEVRL